MEQFSAPLSDTNSDVYKAGLRLESIETAVVPCPFAEDFKEHGDAQRFAKAYIPTIRSWNESVFLGALSGDRPEQQRTELIEAYYQRYQDQVAEKSRRAWYGVRACLYDDYKEFGLAYS